MEKYAFLKLCTSFLLICSLTLSSAEQENYYWRPYTGTIPEDAVPGGKTRDGKTTYIGQTFHSGDVVIPGEIIQSNQELHYAMDGAAHSIKDNVKIFCSQHPELFEWIATDVRAIRFLTHKNLPQGGYDDDYHLLIGRKIWNGAIVVGKVTIYQKYESIGFTADGDSVYRENSFEVLAYNPKIAITFSNFTIRVDPLQNSDGNSSDCKAKVYNIIFTLTTAAAKK